jgi:hypothetical protein
MDHLQHGQMESTASMQDERERAWPSASPAADMSHATCQGCRTRPDRECAACGAPASIWTEAGDGRHAVPWCDACHELLLSGRPTSAKPLVYLPVRKRASVA